MKKANLIVAALAIVILGACMMPLPTAIVKPNSPAKNEVIMTTELKELLAETPRPKTVIRVSNPPANVTEAEKFNAYINMFEKALMQNGFTVRDRALLENLMRSGNADYQTIGQKIDTDIIIDVLSLQFDLPNPVTTYLNETTNQNESFLFPDNSVNCALAKLECRLTIVTKGQLGGMFTFFSSRCDVQDLRFVVNSRVGTMSWVGGPPNEMFRSLSVPIDTEEARTYFVQYFAQALMDQLLEGVNSRLKTAVDLYANGQYAEAEVIVKELLKKDPRNYLLYVSQALLDARQDRFAGAQKQLETALLHAVAPYQRAVVYFGSARVYALKGDQSVALALLRKGLEGGLAGLIQSEDLRSNKDLAGISNTTEFDALIKEFYKPAPAAIK